MAIDNRSKIPTRDLTKAPASLNMDVASVKQDHVGAVPSSPYPISIPGVEDTRGAADTNGNHMPDFLFGDDPRYQACVTVAHELKSKYEAELAALDPKKPEQLARIETIEREIVTTLNTKVHEQLGDYNRHVYLGLEGLPSNLHDDVNRMDTEIPLKLTEVEKGALVCRHYAPIANALCAEAGLNTVRVSTLSGGFQERLGTLTGTETLEGMHTLVLSRATNKLIDFCEKGADAYIDNLTNVPVGQLTHGSMLLTRKGDDVIVYQHIIDPSLMNGSRETLNAMADETVDVAFNAWENDVLPKISQEFTNALAAGDVKTAALNMWKLPASREELNKYLYAAIEKRDLPVTELLIHRGAGDFPAAGYIKAAQHVFEWSFINKDVPPNEAFQRGLAKTLDIAPEKYLKLAKGSPEHEAIARKMIEEEKARAPQEILSPEKAKDAKDHSAQQVLHDDVKANALAAVNIPQDMLVQMRMGADNVGSGVSVGVAQLGGGMNV